MTFYLNLYFIPFNIQEATKVGREKTSSNRKMIAQEPYVIGDNSGEGCMISLTLIKENICIVKCHTVPQEDSNPKTNKRKPEPALDWRMHAKAYIGYM